ncbi:LysR family transcriptional regulator [Psychrobacter lutiphocae]|uniref:LysR family transcriptional regulator n=1 Tax=Psychrobacter lutiphocae TaxID=540500 RepID=UPI0003822248|nr:LysR family transcriptional regulator [Psychrobacter lutiphocae]
MNIKLQQLRHFLFVVEEGGFRSAAAKANRSQATLSSSIKALERQLGKSLFESGNNAVLTTFGKQCLPKIQQFMDIYQRLESELHTAALGKSGKIRIASVPSLATKLLPNVLAEYSKRYPQVEISLLDDNSEGVCSRLLAGDVDVALGNLSASMKDEVQFYPLLTDPIGVVCSVHHPLARHNSGILWQQLSCEPFIYNGTCHLLDTTPAYVLNLNPKYEVGNITSLFSLVRNELGVTTLPKLAFPEYDDKLVWLPLIDPPLQRQIGIFSVKGRSLSPQAEIFTDLCINYVENLKKTQTGWKD